jgi:N6-adenosine-specific RNA methylase IME4
MRLKKGIENYKIELPDKKFNIIYCDPPWSYYLYRPQYNKGNPIRTAASFYKTMTIEEICALPVADIAAENCVLFLWTTNPLLNDAFKVISAWGFQYKTVAFYWNKKCLNSDRLRFGMGYYTRPNCEPLLLAMKGSLKVLDHSIYQVTKASIEHHSKKPDIFRDLIIKLFGNLPRIELFAREKVLGWYSWGNEIDNNS